MGNVIVDAPLRKPRRLHDFDYSTSGYYFVTICIKDKRSILWDAITVGANCVRPSSSKLGAIVELQVERLSATYDGFCVDKYVIMPNHIHMIIAIERADGRTQFAPTVSRAVKQFKGAVTKQIGYSIWQKSYYDHIIRDEVDYNIKWNYIDTNPARWLEDEYCAK